MATINEREQQVFNWSTQEIDGGVKLGDKMAEMLETDGSMFSEADHAEVDHEGLTGVPDITGLLDETAHDLLDHDGLTGILSTAATNQAASTANDAAGIVTDFNILLGKLKTAGLMAADL